MGICCKEGIEQVYTRSYQCDLDVLTNVVFIVRSWDKVFCIARGTQIAFYKDSKSAKSTPEQYFKGESPMDLNGATVKIADDYTKKKHVFRIRYVPLLHYIVGWFLSFFQ